MPDIHIPPQAGMALAKEMRRQCGIAIHPSTAIAAIRAALENWPGMEKLCGEDVGPVSIILPLTEPRE